LKELKTLSEDPRAQTMAVNNTINEREIRENLLQNYSRDSNRAVSDASNKVLSLARSSKDLRQLVTGLDSIRVLCRVEAGRLGADSVSLTPVIDQLDKFHKEIDKSLGIILDHADKVSSLIDVASSQSVYSVDKFGRGG
jgi:aerotaxis receptor